MLKINITNKSHGLILKGYPWVLLKDMVFLNSAHFLAENGELVQLVDNKGRFIATGFFNPNTKISVRVLSLNPKQKIDENFFKEKFEMALKKRKKYFKENYFRLCYGESDGLPGLIIDLYGKHAVAQVNAAGMDRLQNYWLPALLEVVRGQGLEIKGIYLDASGKHRTREGLDNESKVIYGGIPDLIEVKENALTYYADLYHGQKTGWFYDQRDNRKFLAELAKGKTFLDLYTHSGGFGLLAGAHGTSYVEIVDRSQLGLGLAKKAYKQLCHPDPKASGSGIVETPTLKVGVTENISFIKADVFDYLDNSKQKFDIVNADPPAFIKNRKDIEAGLKGYEKLVKKCLPLVNESGIFAISSCSYFARPEQFQKTVEKVLLQTGRNFKLLHKSGADKDHPIHPMLSETNYLKFLVYRLDTVG